MSKKLVSILSGSAMAAMLLVGCNMNDQEPPPEDNGVEENGDMDMEEDNGMNDNTEPAEEDKNTPNDKDPAKDPNTPEEDAVEDDIDMQDADNKDE
ncbi:hypothetical protein AAEO50_00235 [Rossellomorea oryzaecorticis]|uniref:Uncharacterized protein n=1 Tax=Rossellomorea oryzaecorticis TaxID=1396505 RepID=A0ABU9K3N4_9BACI